MKKYGKNFKVTSKNDVISIFEFLDVCGTSCNLKLGGRALDKTTSTPDN